MPAMGGVRAQRMVRNVYGDIPLIFVTGELSDARALEALQSTHVDYVLKSNLIRLPSVVKRAVGEARERKRLERSLDHSNERAIDHSARLERVMRRCTVTP
jgi:DNA-binding NtrC family response regulator